MSHYSGPFNAPRYGDRFHKMTRSKISGSSSFASSAKRRAVRSNDERFAATRAELIAAARRLFAERGYAATATENLVANAGTTRGALYYHFKDKEDAFRAVIEQVAREIAASINVRSRSASTPLDRLLDGCEAFLIKSLQPDIARVYLIDGPAVLGWSQWRQLDAEFAALELEEAVAEVVGAAANRSIIRVRATAISGLLTEVALLAALEPGSVKRTVLLRETRAIITAILRDVPS